MDIVRLTVGVRPNDLPASCRPVRFVGNVQIPAYRDRAQARRQARLHSNSWFTHELLVHVTNGESELPMGTLSHALKQSVISAPLPFISGLKTVTPWPIPIEARLPFSRLSVSVFCSVGCPTNGKFVGHGISMCFVKEWGANAPSPVREARVDKMGIPHGEQKCLVHDLSWAARDVLGVSQAVRERGIYTAKGNSGRFGSPPVPEADFANRLSTLAEFELLSDVLRQTRIL